MSKFKENDRVVIDFKEIAKFIFAKNREIPTVTQRKMASAEFIKRILESTK